jgi:hypothetical protein
MSKTEYMIVLRGEAVAVATMISVAHPVSVTEERFEWKATP